MKRGEVRWCRFQAPDKRRPVLILTRDSVIEYLGEVTVAPITSTIRDIPSEVTIGLEDGMPRTCAVNCDHLQTIQKARLGAAITKLDRSRMDEVGQAVRFALNI